MSPSELRLDVQNSECHEKSETCSPKHELPLFELKPQQKRRRISNQCEPLNYEHKSYNNGLQKELELLREQLEERMEQLDKRMEQIPLKLSQITNRVIKLEQDADLHLQQQGKGEFKVVQAKAKNYAHNYS